MTKEDFIAELENINDDDIVIIKEDLYTILYDIYCLYEQQEHFNYLNKPKRISKYDNARSTIEELLKDDMEKEKVLRVIDTAIFWKNTSKEDIRLDYKRKLETSLNTHFKHEDTISIIEIFSDIKKSINNQ